MAESTDAAKYIAGLIERARKAQKTIEFASQEQVDELALRIGWGGCEPSFAKALAEKAVEETGMGIVEHKIGKTMTKVKGALYDMKGQKSVGVVEVDDKMGIMKLAKPMGVIGALIPVTNCEATPFVKAVSAIKTRNAIVMAAHPRAKETNVMAVERIRKVLKDNGWPEDLVVNMDEISVENSGELMAQSDLVLATGGGGMVKAAYKSGTPSQGVGAGNAVSIIDETADLASTAHMVFRSKTFDHATSCSTENSIVIQESVYQDAIKALEAEGGYLCDADEKKKLQKALWPEGKGLNKEIVAQSPEKIAGIAGIDLPKGKKFFMVEETGVGKDYPFSGEKLSVTTTLYKYKEFQDAIDMVNLITGFSGPGHSCGIHTTDDTRIKELARQARVSRIMIRQPQCLANSGAWTNGMPMSMTLGCGSWGGNSVSENVTWKHLLNYTWVSFPIKSHQPSDRELFGTIMDEPV